MRFVIVTGMSGAGKSSVLKMLEDIGYFCVDNLPIKLITKFSQLVYKENSELDKVALGIDIRSGQALEEVEDTLKQLTHYQYKYEILYLDATTEVLVKRYKETRRMHPLASEGRMDKGIEIEREKINYLKNNADIILDTSQLLIRELKEAINKIFLENKTFQNFYITVLSFGFKYGIPTDADLVFDVRFLPNPYYIPELKSLTGNDKPVYEYVLSTKVGEEFLKKLEDLLAFLIPNYISEGKNQLVIAVGCTGGKHRSVTIANQLSQRLNSFDYGLKVEHRDILKDSLHKK